MNIANVVCVLCSQHFKLMGKSSEYLENVIKRQMNKFESKVRDFKSFTVNTEQIVNHFQKIIMKFEIKAGKLEFGNIKNILNKNLFIYFFNL